MARPRTRCDCGKSTKSPHGLFMHRLRMHWGRNWNRNGLVRKKRAA